MTAKVKIFNECYVEALEKEVNAFLKEVDLCDDSHLINRERFCDL